MQFEQTWRWFGAWRPRYFTGYKTDRSYWNLSRRECFGAQRGEIQGPKIRHTRHRGVLTNTSCLPSGENAA